MWDHQQNLKNLLEATQRRAARRIMHDFSPSTSATELLNRLELPPLHLRRSVDKASLLYKVVNRQVDWEPPRGLLVPATRSLRGRSDRFLQPHSRTDAHLHSLFPSAIRMWNALPQEAASAPSISSFKSSVEDWLGMSR